MKCWAEDYCRRRGNCNEYCDAYVILKAIYSQTNMPRRYQFDIKMDISKNDPDIQAFLFLKGYMENVIKNVEEGRGLYLWGETTGNGKTTWATKIANYYIRKIALQSGLENEVVYINVPTFLEDLRASYDEQDPEFDRLKDLVLHAKLAIFDDIGTEKPTEWVQERLYTIINQRENDGLCTIYTSNIPLENLHAQLGKRIASRIRGSATVIELKGKDKRGLSI